MTRIIEVEFLPRSSIETEQTYDLVFDIEVDLGPSWMDPIISYLKDGTLAKDSNEAYQVRVQTTRYLLSPNQKLFRRSFAGPYLRCVPQRRYPMFCTNFMREAAVATLVVDH